MSATVKGIEARIDPRTERTAARKQGSVAVIPVFGVITPRPSILEFYGLTISTQTIGQRVRDAVADPDVKAIVLDVDSPGGAVSGVSELAAELRGAKPIVAHADYLVASAAYWIAAQADEIVASPSARVGSVGVYGMHVDQSGMLQQLGLKVSLIGEPAEKIEGNPFEPLGEDAEAHMRSSVAQELATFRADVVAGRPQSTVSDAWARVYTAKDAKAMGMVDKIRTMSETLGAYGIDQARAAQAGRQRAMELRSAQLNAALAEFQSLGVSV